MLATAPLAVEIVTLDRLFCSPSNPRKNDDAVDQVAASLRRFGFQQPVVAKRSGEVIAGNTRLKAAKKLGIAEVPVVWFDGSDVDATAYAIADNRTHEFSEWDDPALAKLLEQLRAEDALEGVGFDNDEIDKLLVEAGLAVPCSVEDPGAQEPPVTPVTRRGDLWVLGDHRLLCGDSTKPEDVARLMGEDRAPLMATDPPYLVDYDGSNHPQGVKNQAEARNPNKEWDDYVDPTASVEFFAGFIGAALSQALVPNPAVYQWHASRRQALVEQAWTRCGLFVHQQIIWVKSRPILTRSHYMWQHEPCFYGWLTGKTPTHRPEVCGENSTVWTIGCESDGIHPTQKPLEIFERPILAHTREGDAVYEPFSGSGSQLIAAEKLGRRCRAMEIAPAFVDAAVLRWQKATGKAATLDGSGLTFDQVTAERTA